MSLRRQAPLQLDALSGGPVGEAVKSAVDSVLHEVVDPDSALHKLIDRRNHIKPHERGSPIPISLSTCQVAAKAAYKSDPGSIGEGWELLRHTKNVKLWRHESTYLVGVAGTDKLDPSDLFTDVNLPFNSGEATHRIQTDLQTVRGWKAEFPDGSWYGTGHSLGGAVLDVMLLQDLLIAAVTFNPAVEPRNFHRSTRNFRIYTRGDPIYTVMGQFVTGDDVQVRDVETPHSGLPGLLDSVQHLRHQHNVDRFEGGRGRKRARVQGGGPPPTYAEDIEAASLVYKKPRVTGKHSRVLTHLLPPDQVQPYVPTRSLQGLSPSERVMIVVADNLATVGGVQRLDGGALDTTHVAFYITYDPYGGPRAEKSSSGEWHPFRKPHNKFPSAFNFEHMKHAYPIGSTTAWSLHRRTILVAVRGTSSAADALLDVRQYFSDVIAESAIYKDKVRAPVRNAQLKYPRSENDYFAAGHSLGGALADELVREHLVLGSVDFNPLINTHKTIGTTDPAVIQRLYMSNDPVFAALAGKDLTPFASTIKMYPSVASDAHSMANFMSQLDSSSASRSAATMVKPPPGDRALLRERQELGYHRETARLTNPFLPVNHLTDDLT